MLKRDTTVSEGYAATKLHITEAKTDPLSMLLE